MNRISLLEQRINLPAWQTSVSVKMLEKIFDRINTMQFDFCIILCESVLPERAQ